MSIEAGDISNTSDRKHHKRANDDAGDLERHSKKKRKYDRETEVIESSTAKKHRASKKNSTSKSKSEQTAPFNSIAQSLFQVQTSSLYLPLSPISQLHPIQSLCAEHLSPLILTYYHIFHGIVLSYQNVRLSETPELPTVESEQGSTFARSVDEYAVTFVWVTADFLIFRPQRGETIEGWVNLQNEGHLGLVCWNLFNASIEKRRLPRDWTWVPGGVDGHVKKTKHFQTSSDSGISQATAPEASSQDDQDSQGYYVDRQGKKVKGRIVFRVIDTEASASTDRERDFVSIEGTLLDDKEEETLSGQRVIRNQRLSEGISLGGRVPSCLVSGASTKHSLSDPLEMSKASRSNRKVD